MTSGDVQPEVVIDDLRAAGRRARFDVLTGVQGHRLIVLAGGADDPVAAASALAGAFGPGPVVAGPLASDLFSASRAVSVALAGLRAAAAWPEAPRPVAADDLLPERALDGDPEARDTLIREVYDPLRRAGSPLLDTLTTYLEQGMALESTARLLYVHPNTVRYRLRRVTDLTALNPSQGRAAFALQIAITLGRLGTLAQGL